MAVPDGDVLAHCGDVLLRNGTLDTKPLTFEKEQVGISDISVNYL
jgi:hypothetical protein